MNTVLSFHMVVRLWSVLVGSMDVRVSVKIVRGHWVFVLTQVVIVCWPS